MDTHEVQVTELDPDRLARENNWIGANRIKYEEPEDRVEKIVVKKEDDVEGMDLKPKAKKIIKKTELKTEKDVKKFVKSVATKNVQKSKIFQKKKDVEARKNKKKMRREDRNREKILKKKSKRDKRKN